MKIESDPQLQLSSLLPLRERGKVGKGAMVACRTSLKDRMPLSQTVIAKSSAPWRSHDAGTQLYNPLMPLNDPEQLLVELDRPLSDALKRAARRARKSPAEMLQRLLREKLEEDGDYKAVLAFRKRRGKTFSLAEVKRRHGLAD
jgi:hypothetical protein